MSKKDQLSLLGDSDGTVWGDEWQNMPEFVQEDLKSRFQIIVHFETEEDVAAFAEKIGQKVYPTTRSIWYPEAEIGNVMNKRFIREP